MKQLFALLLLCLNVGVLWGQGDVRQRGSGGDQSSQPAQSRRVTGRVLDAAGQPVTGATVAVVDRASGKTISGTYSDANGNFAVDVDPSADLNLRISFVGFATVTQPITPTSNNLKIDLQEEGTTLETQVIETGITTVDRKAKTGTIYTIQGDEFRDMPTQSFARAIQARMPGVNIITSNGVPGALPTIRIRGIATLTAGREPLYIVDGVRMNTGPNQGAAGADRGRVGITGSIFNTINPNDIETMTVLTESSQISPYGAEGANGVVVITTRRGRAGKTRVNLGYQRGAMELIRQPDIMNAAEWDQYMRESYTNAGISLTSFNNTYGPFLAAGNDIDHVNELFRVGMTEEINASVSGGNERTTFFLSTNYSFADAQSRGVKFERAALRTNLSHRFDDVWKIDVITNLAMVEQNAATTAQGGNFVNNTFRSALFMPPVTPMILNGDFNLATGTTGLFNYESELRNQRVSITNGLQSSVALSAQILPWLTQTTRLTLDWSEIEERQVNNPLTQSGAGTTGSVNNSSSRDINYAIEPRFNMIHTFEGGHTLGGVVGLNYRQETRRIFTAVGIGLAFPGLDQLSNTATPNATTGNFVQSAKINFFNQATYNYKERYYVTAALGLSTSSRFGPQNRWGYFPSISGKVRLTNEPWFPKPNWLNELAVRTSYGVSGNDLIGANTWVPNIGTGAAYNNLPGLAITTLANLQFGWEDVIALDMGVEAELFDNRLTIQMNYYERYTVGALFTRQVSAFGSSPSTNSLVGNIANVENVGVEWVMNTKNLTGELKWETTLNMSYLENRISGLPNNNADDPGNNWFFNRPIGSIWVAKYAGVNPADGRPMFYDRNQNITYFPTVADNQFMRGNSEQPTFYGNLENRWTYKGLTLTVNIGWEQGRLNFVQDRFFNAYARTERNQTRDMLNRWTTPGQITSVPIAWQGSVMPGASSPSVGGSGAVSSALWSSADFIRLRQVSLSYALPSSFVQKLGLTEVSIYFQGINLWTYTPYIGIDPEIRGADASLIPQAKQYVGGINITL